ncbi:transient receptor potential cation channel subfamily V member 1, partial [Brachionichthys hirsutus]|uniref:transient receptor potential cation channel subfamily V member 1 n=1 Tax=Brachionichthys hirsutus TaxID=412623 RepID=UPI00360520D9
MKKSEMFGFTLEADDRTDEDRQRRNDAERAALISKSFGEDSPITVMDTDIQEKMEETKPQIRYNLNFDTVTAAGLSVVSRTQGDVQKFNIERLFDAAASRDVRKLAGLHRYLEKNMKRLSDSLYKSYGKTALMKGLLHLKDGKNETVELLIDISEKLGDIQDFINSEYTSSYYKGQTALHIATERRSISHAKLLVSKGADVHAKACGTFFQPHDGASFYFGELPLSLAACTNQPDMVDFLMENQYQKADAKQADSHGNTALHALVVVADNSADNTEFVASMYDRILRNASKCHPKPNLEDIENKKGLTPLKMAAKTGKIGLFSHILKREFSDSSSTHLSRKFTEWVYGPVTCSLYDLASLDSYEDNSVLEILVYGSNIPNRHEMLQIEPLNRLLQTKWKRFAGGMFLSSFLVYLLYLVLFTAVAYNKKEEKTPFTLERSVMGYLYLSGQVFLLVANCYFFFTGIIDIKRKRPKLQTLLIDGYYEILFFFQATLFLVSAGLYLSGHQEYLGFLVLCLALSWVNILYFSRGDLHMGIYSVMIQKMILSDIMRFLFVYAVFLFGFSAAVVTLLIEPPVRNATRGRAGLFQTLDPGTECVKPSFRNISYTTLQLFKFTIGMGDMEFTENYKYKEVFYVLLIGYIILTYILLLNMLIALMNRTVERTAKESTSIWNLQRAVTILDMEKKLPCCLRRRFRCGVVKNLCAAPGEDRRCCFRVEETNWNKWNINLGKINEDPGCWDPAQPAGSDAVASRPRGRSWRGFFTESSRRGQTYQ